MRGLIAGNWNDPLARAYPNEIESIAAWAGSMQRGSTFSEWAKPNASAWRDAEERCGAPNLLGPMCREVDREAVDWRPIAGASRP